jgi:hypothetical protein
MMCAKSLTGWVSEGSESATAACATRELADSAAGGRRRSNGNARDSSQTRPHRSISFVRCSTDSTWKNDARRRRKFLPVQPATSVSTPSVRAHLGERRFSAALTAEPPSAQWRCDASLRPCVSIPLPRCRRWLRA